MKPGAKLGAKPAFARRSEAKERQLQQFDVTVLGLGYVGLPIALMLARSGLATAGFDIDARRIARLRGGDCPIDEPDLVAVFDAVAADNPIAYLDAVQPSDTFLIAVPTPLKASRKIADLGAVADALRSIVPHLAKGNMVVINSTCPVMTCRDVAVPILERSGLKVDQDFHLAYCPERIFPGSIAHEMVHNEHVIGGHDAAATNRAVALYRRFVEADLIATDDRTAEFCKLIENTYRDVNIALANELGSIAGRFGIDVGRAIDIANRHPRVNVLKPGIGVGGHCLPIDPWFIVEMAPEESALIPTARQVNDRQPMAIAGRIRRAVAGRRDATLGFYGVTYKADVNDQRESPAWQIITSLQDDGYAVKLYDPVAELGDYADLAAFAADVDIVIALVEHAEFRDAVANDASDIDGTPLIRFSADWMPADGVKP